MRFKKMHMGLIVVALSLVLGSALNTLPVVKANPSGLLYYYDFEHGYWDYPHASNNNYGDANINTMTWVGLDHYDSSLKNLVEVSGTGVIPTFQSGTKRFGNNSLNLYTADGYPWNRNIDYPSPATIDHSNDLTDRVQLGLIPIGKPGFAQGTVFYLGFSMMIPSTTTPGDRYADYFNSNSDNQWISLLTMHTSYDNSPFQIDVATDGVLPNNKVRLKGRAFTLNCPQSIGCSTPQTDSWFSNLLDRGVWYDFIVKSKMSDVSDGYVVVRMKKQSDSSFTDVFNYYGPVGWTNSNYKDTVTYLPKLILYRAKNPDTTSSNDRQRKHWVYIDEVRVGTGTNEAVVYPAGPY